jgi:hypothetical protein
MKYALIVMLLFSSLAFAGTSSCDHASAWPNSEWGPYNLSIWSSYLPRHYANCISEKDNQGNTIVNPVNGDVTCKMDSKGNYLGTSPDGRTVIDSDAIRACKVIGGDLRDDGDYAPHVVQTWSKIIDTNNPKDALWYTGNDNWMAGPNGPVWFRDRNSPEAIICIAHCQ